MKILRLPFLFLWDIAVFVGKIFSSDKQSSHPNEMSWGDFISGLKPADQVNVNSLIARLGAINEQVPLAVVSVGSTVTRRRAYYNDIDLLLLPLHQHNIGLAEKVFADFACTQPETRRKGTVIPSGDDNYDNEPEETSEAYSVKRGWRFEFGDGCATIHLLIIGHDEPSVARCRMTLEVFRQGERDRYYHGKLFSVRVVGEPESV